MAKNPHPRPKIKIPKKHRQNPPNLPKRTKPKTKKIPTKYNHVLLLSWMLFACCVFNLLICMDIRYISSPPQA